jgi:hypothetical protein
MALSGLVFAIGLAVAAIVLLPLLVGGVFVIVVVANRADQDPTGRRPAVVYGFATAFVTLFIALFATAGLVASLSDLIGSHAGRGGVGGVFGGLSSGSRSGSLHPVGDAVARGSVLSILIALVAGVVYYLHATAAARASDDAAATDPIARVRASYVSAVSFVCVMIAVVSLVVVLYDVFRVVAPGVFSPDAGGDSAVAVRSMLPALYLAVASIALLLMHLRHAPPPLRPRYADRLPRGPLDRRPVVGEAPAA